jgi:hypothetical protein
LSEELENRRRELLGAEGCDVVAGHQDEPPVRQQGSERVRRRAAAVPVADDDQRGGGNRPQCVGGRRHEGVEDKPDGPRVNPALPDPVHHGLLGRPGWQRGSAVGGGQYPAVPVGPVALGVERIEALPAHDRMSRAGATGEQAQHEFAAHGIAAQVEVVEPQVPDERQHVIGEDVGRVASGIVRSPAVPVPAQFGQDDPVAVLAKRRDQALTGQPRPATHYSVQQDEGPPGPDLPPGQFNAIQAREPLHRQVRHAHCLPRPRTERRRAAGDLGRAWRPVMLQRDSATQPWGQWPGRAEWPGRGGAPGQNPAAAGLVDHRVACS